MERSLATLSGWGRVARSSSVVLSPADTDEIGQVFGEAPRAHGLIVHAGGRSYGDSALNAQGHVVRTGGLTGLAFDPSTGLLQAEPGVTFRQLLSLLPEGFMVPVSPGTGLATLGGAIAHDVHGKNPDAGSFGRHVVELDLLCADGVRRTIGPDRDPALFQATVGGLGLTGIVTRVVLRLRREPGRAMRVRERRVPDLEALLAALQAAEAPYCVGWIDGLARRAALGRGIVETAAPSAESLPSRPARAWRVPFDLPEAALRPLAVRLFNAAYQRRIPPAGRSRVRPVEDFLYPLDALEAWNRLYGRRGFHQFQAVVPFGSAPAALAAWLEAASDSRRAFLAVLKRLGPDEGPGMVSFTRPGFTLALDFPAGPGIEELYARLVAITLRYGGRVYLAKDALLTPAAFREMYPRWREFSDMLDRVDPQRRFQSDMSRRLGIRAER